MPDYSLVPVDYQPDFDDYSLVPVDYDPFAADGVAHHRRSTGPGPAARPAAATPTTGAGQPDAGAPAAGGGPSGSGGGGIGPTGGAPNPTLDQGAAKAAPFGGYSLVPVDYQPDFDGYYPFAADGLTQQAQISTAANTDFNRCHHSRNSLRGEPMSPASMGQRPAMAPANWAAALASSALAAPKVATFRAAMRGSDFESAERAWDAAAKEMRDLGAQHYPNEAKSSSFIPELGVEIFKRGGPTILLR